jgi:hypothetical protein
MDVHDISGKICSVPLASCLQEMTLGAPSTFHLNRFAVVLGRTLTTAVLAFNYNSNSLSLCLRGRNTACTLDGYDDQNNPTYIICDGDSTCAQPDIEAQLKFA